MNEALDLPAHEQPSYNEEFVQRTMDALHRLFWNLRLDQLGSWSEKLGELAQIDLHILKIIADDPSVILKDIVTRLDIPSSTLTSAINRLEKRGLLQRLISQRDRRSYGLELTPLGWEIKREHEKVDRMLTDKVLEALASEEAHTFVELLNKVCQRLAR